VQHLYSVNVTSFIDFYLSLSVKIFVKKYMFFIPSVVYVNGCMLNYSNANLNNTETKLSLRSDKFQITDLYNILRLKKTAPFLPAGLHTAQRCIYSLVQKWVFIWSKSCCPHSSQQCQFFIYDLNFCDLVTLWLIFWHIFTVHAQKWLCLWLRPKFWHTAARLSCHHFL